MFEICDNDCYFFSQFNPESFVDGLLGVGEAGGTITKRGGSGVSNSKTIIKNNEGKELAKRLLEMRKGRDLRAAATAATGKEEASLLSKRSKSLLENKSSDSGGKNFLKEGDQVDDFISGTATATAERRKKLSSRNKSKSKKKKKGKKR